MTTYTRIGKEIVEKAKMEKPFPSEFGFWRTYHDAATDYENHIASLKRYPILNEADWFNMPDELVEGKDFITEVWCNDPFSYKGILTKTQTTSCRCEYCKEFAIPLPPEETKQERSQHELWFEALTRIEDTSDKGEAIDYLKQHYTLTPKPQ